MGSRHGAPERALVTGGAGFIGTHLVDALLARGDAVRVLDNLDPQAHANGTARHLSKAAELVVGDLRDADAVARSLEGVSVVYHLGGMVGNGQSMIDVRRYVDSNSVGTATLLEQLVARRAQIRRLVVASSMVVYGDGAYCCPEHGELASVERSAGQLAEHRWEPACPECGLAVEPTAISEARSLRPTSVYGICKRDQEELCLVVGCTRGLPTVALRYLCTYGSRQALGNPYTGVAAIWAARLLNGRRPVVFEDGAQIRDFVHVSDVAAATIAAADAGPEADFQVFNIGSGHAYTIVALAQSLVRALGSPLTPELTGEWRVGDIRHCFADISRAQRVLGWQPQVDLEAGIAEFADWAREQHPEDRSDHANQELRAQGVIR